MKKKLIFIFNILVIFSMMFCNTTFANVNDIWEESEFRSIYVSDDIRFEGVFNKGKEVKVVLPDGSEQFTKKANIRGEFFKNAKNEIILSANLEVTFTYNNIDSWVENPLTDIVRNNYSVKDSKWRITNNEEIYVSPEQCIVSEQSSLYKKSGWFNIRKSWLGAGNFHNDIVCSSKGEIKFNSDSLGDLKDKSVISKDVLKEEKVLQDGIVRKTNMTDEVYVSSKDEDEKDKYSYVTRRMESTYFDKKNNKIADTIIQINFRYNRETKEVECISTSHKEIVSASKSSIDVYLRTGDKTRNYAGAFGEIKLDYKVKGSDGEIDESLIANCDYNGNIVSLITTK